MLRPHGPAPELLSELRERLAAWKGMAVHRRLYLARVAGLERMLSEGRAIDRALKLLSEEMDRSEAWCRARGATCMQVEFPENLPISQHRERITRAIEQHRAVVVCGETGSGKSTQLPKICLALGRGSAGMIGHTQPRRIAARSVATRLSEELRTPLGEGVGYKVRFGDRVSPETRIKIMTDGILLSETQGDPYLEQYDTIIVDEAHERSLNIDFLLGYLRRLIDRRDDLKVLITSATIDPQRFSDHFGGRERCPIIEVSGRTYPVELVYEPCTGEDDDEREDRMEDRIVKACADLVARGPGDILVFLPGEREIRETAERLREAGWGRDGTEVVPLYARLSGEEQMRVFAPHRGVRVVLATNVAETSLTVPGIRYVVDTGLARISRYSPKSKVQRLPVESISRASADQRAGRCGRIGPGVCVRLYSREDYERRAAFTEPEIQRTNLASVILRMAAIGLGDPASFPFVQPPDARLIADGYATLQELGAIDARRRLTPIGRAMARLPVDPRVARILLAARDLDVLREGLIVASALSIQDPRERRMSEPGGPERADEAHAVHRADGSDFLSLINLWRFFQEQSSKLSGSRLRKLCRTNCLSFVRMREWQDVHRQLEEMMRELSEEQRAGRPGAVASPVVLPDEEPSTGRRDGRHSPSPASSSPRRAAGGEPWQDRLHRAILTGFLSNVGVRGDHHEYRGTHGNMFSLFPGSTLFEERPKWVVSAELVRTSRLYARCNAKIRPEWIEEAASHLLKRSYSDPHYDERTGRVMAYEQATLFGLPVVERRRVHYGPIRPAQARDLFIQHGLVEGLWRSTGRFARHNAALLERVRAAANKLRRADLLHDTSGRYAFFDSRLPADVYSGDAFERWRQREERQRPRLLFMQESDLLPGSLLELSERQFPDQWHVGGGTLPLIYRSDPTAPDDGVTLVVPVEALESIQADALEWLVPGMLAEKIEAMLRALPRDVRASLLPLSATAERAALAALSMRGEGRGLAQTVADALNAVAPPSGAEIHAEDLNPTEVPAHLRMNLRVVDAAGNVLAQGRDLTRLRVELAGRVRAALEGMPENAYNSADVRSWDFGDLPESATIEHRGMRLVVYPALVDECTRVSLRPLPSPHAARREHLRGCIRLASVYVREELERAIRYAVDLDHLGLLYAPVGRATVLRAGLGVLIARLAFFGDGVPVRAAVEFEDRIRRGLPELEHTAERVGALVTRILEARQAAARAVGQLNAPSAAESRADMDDHLRRLLPPEFLETTPPERLEELPRYLRALRVRAPRAAADPVRDRAKIDRVRPWEGVLAELAERPCEALPRNDREVERFRWMLEEYRVSLFAQELGTLEPVSPQRLERQWKSVFAVTA